MIIIKYIIQIINMKILFDLTATQPTLTSKIHGGGEYAKAVFYALVDKINLKKFECVYYKNRLIDNDILKFCVDNKIKLITIIDIKELSKVIDQGDYDKFYSALPYKYINITSKKTKFIYTLHGLRTYEVYSDKYEAKYIKSRLQIIKLIKKNLLSSKEIAYKKFYKLLNNESNIEYIVTSKHTLYSYINTYPFFKEKNYTLLYSPIKLNNFEFEFNKFDIENTLSFLGVESKKYFLLINGDRWIKNNYRALLAIDRVYSQFPNINIKTILLGITDNKILKKIKNKKRFIIKDYIDSKQLEILYKEAYAFIYPTLNEGFGYPPLEAMKYGTPVLASGTSSIPEICGEAVVYFNPYLVNEISIKIVQILFDKEIITELFEKGIKRSDYIRSKQNEMLNKLVEIIIR